MRANEALLDWYYQWPVPAGTAQRFIALLVIAAIVAAVLYVLYDRMCER